MSMVEWKKLGEVTKIIRGNRVTKSDLIDNGLYPVISGGFSPLGFIDRYNRDENTITIAQYGSAGYVDWQKDKFWANDVCYSVYPLEHLNNKFLYYSLINKQHDIYLLRTNAVPAHLPLSKLQDVDIPVPNLKEQERIVGVLDTFTSSIENLKEQITQRRKQYEHYRDQLLDLDGKEGVEMKTIQEICTHICSGGTPSTSHKEYYEGVIPWLRTQEIDWKDIFDTEIKITEEAIANSSAKIIPANCIIVAMYGATAAKVAINKIPLSTNQACCNLEIDSDQALYKFVYYWLCKEYLNLKSMGEGSQNNINGKKVKDYPIPVPPITEQQRIVSILDTFEASIQNLEAQLVQREKQYEYYRNKLLTFE
jgi:type I restriction enzyme S subunit